MTNRMEWQPIETAPKDGRNYEISTRGEFRVDGRIRAPYLSDRGYPRVTLGRRSVAVHRLVAQHFIPNPHGHREVNHLDGDKKNNHIDNLEWCSRSENMKHAYSAGLHPGVRLCGKDSPNWKRNGDRHPQSMPVRAIFPDGVSRDYASQGLAAEDGFSPSKISLCINGRRKSHGGATWMPLPPPPLVDHPRPTTPVVDHEGGESDPLRAFADAAYESTGGPTQGLKDTCAAYRENEKATKTRRAKIMDDLVAESAHEIFTPLETKQATRISELEAEVERLKVAVEAEREACAQIADVYANGIGEFTRGTGILIAAAIRARSTAMNKGGE